MAAVLCFGLGKESRSRKYFAELKIDFDTLLSMRIADELSIISHKLSKLGGVKRMPRPRLLLEGVFDKKGEKKEKVFKTKEDFHRRWNELRGKQDV